jgi:hypothetical protein
MLNVPTQSRKLSQSIAALALVSTMGFTLTGCGIGAPSPVNNGHAIVAPAMRGQLYGGPNPIIGSTVKVYVTSSNGYGVSTQYSGNAWAQEATAATQISGYPSGDTDANGNFSFAGGYDCPAGQYAYIVSSGGNSGSSTPTTQATLGTPVINGGGGVTSIPVTNGGAGYNYATVTITPSDSTQPTTAATATAVVTNGVITSITITASGGGYDQAPTAAISSPNMPNGPNNQAVLVAALGRCDDLYTSIGGGEYSGYIGNPIYVNELSTVAAAYALGRFSSVTGTGAATVVQIGSDPANNAPEVGPISQGTIVAGSGATATAAETGGAVTTPSVVTGGTGYTSAPPVIISGGGGTGAYATATVSGGAVTGFTLISGGSGYTSAPTVNIAPAYTAGLYHAFLNAANLVNVYNYTASANSTTTAYTGQSGVIPIVPQALINTIANILVSCVNSTGGTYNDGSACGKLFYYTAPTPSTAANNTFTGMTDLAANPTLNGSGSQVTSLYGVAGAFTSVYSPPLSASTNLNDYSIGIEYPATFGNSTTTAPLATCPYNATLGCQGIIFPTSGAVDINDNYYSGNQSTTGGSANVDVLAFSSNGALNGETNTNATLKGTFGLSVDAIGNGYTANGSGASGTNELGHFTFSGGIPGTTLATLTTSTGITNEPFNTAVDAANNVWAFGPLHTATDTIFKSAAGGASFTGIAAPATASGANSEAGLSIDPNQNIWVSAGTTVSIVQNTGSIATPTYSSSSVATVTTTVSPAVALTFAGTSASSYTTYASGYTTAGVQPITFTLSGNKVTSPTAGSNVTPAAITGTFWNEADGAGNIWIADYNSHSVQAFNPTTGLSYKMKPCIVSSNACTSIWGTLKPYYVSIDSAGSVWVPVPTASTGFIVQIIGAAAPTWPLLSLGQIGQP